MATYYVKPNITSGTGAGTLGDPWNIEDVCATGNPKSLAAYDILFLMTNGVTQHALAAILGANFGVSPVYVLAVDYSGNPTADRFVCDGSGVGAGDLAANLFGSNSIHIGLELNNGPAKGFSYASPDYMSFYNCAANNNATFGFFAASQTSYSQLTNCRFVDNGDTQVGTNSVQEVIKQCYIEGLVSAGNLINHASGSNNIYDGNILVMKGDSIAANHGLYVRFFDTVKNNIVYRDTPASGGASASGIYMWNSRNYIFDNIVQGIKGSATSYGYGAASSTGVGFERRNIAYDCDAGANANFAASQGYSGIDVVTNPDFTNIAGRDFTPKTDMKLLSTVINIAQEVSWIRPGALSDLIAGGGGGGGLQVSPFRSAAFGGR